ncbi:MAG TPA: hypothetical protein PLK77_10250, partial [Pyrinomonadaceae bacterium]|nr:hypothetical protein [Pyrinomonadaceae bacterium]
KAKTTVKSGFYPSSFILSPLDVARATFFFARLRLIFCPGDLALLSLSESTVFKNLNFKIVRQQNG